MRRFNPVVRFLSWFALLYGLLILPWPGWNAIYCDYFRTVNKAVYSRDDGPRMVRFTAAHVAHPSIDTIITVANRDRVNASGRVPAMVLELDARSVGWVPTALIIALIAASPVPWKRRGIAFFWGLLFVHLFILFSVGVYVWDASTGVGLITLTPFWKTIVDGLVETLVTQLGASFVVPSLIWLLVTFRIREFSAMKEPEG